MQTRRAVLALISADEAAALLEAAGWTIAARARSVQEAAEMVRAHQPDLLLADAILPGGDGETLARAALMPGLSRYADLALLVPRGLTLPGADRLEALGVTLLEAPLTAEGLTRIGADPGFLPPERAKRLDGLLDQLGVPPHPGRTMLRRAAALVWRDRRRLDNLRDRVYPEAARPLGKSPQQAERAIRHVIEAAWRRGDIEAQNRLFGDTIDARRGRPTCGEMIAQLADILRWEG